MLLYICLVCLYEVKYLGRPIAVKYVLKPTWHGLRPNPTPPPIKTLLGIRLRFLLLTYGHTPSKPLLGLRLHSLLLTYGHPFQTVMALTVHINEKLRLKPKRANLLVSYSAEKYESGTSLRVKQCGTPKTGRFADRDTGGIHPAASQ